MLGITACRRTIRYAVAIHDDQRKHSELEGLHRHCVRRLPLQEVAAHRLWQVAAQHIVLGAIVGACKQHVVKLKTQEQLRADWACSMVHTLSETVQGAVSDALIHVI